MANGQDQIGILEKKLQRARHMTWVWCFLIFVLTIANIYQYIAFVQPNSKEADFAKYPFIDPSRHIIKQEHFLTTVQPLRDYLKNLVETETNADISIYYEFLNTGANISINPDDRYYPASLIKLPIAIVAMKKVQDGEWRLDSELVLMTEDINEEFGDIYTKYSVGDRITVEEVIKWSLMKSDNTAHDMLFRNTTTDERVAFIDDIGLYELFDQDFSVTTKEYARIFRSLYTASYLNREYSQKVLEWLTQAEFKDYLSYGLGPEAKFAHKYGIHVSNNIFADAGIVYYPNRPYLLVVIIKGKFDNHEENRALATSIMHNISSKAYELANQ